MASMKTRVLTHIDQVLAESTPESLAKMIKRLETLGAPQSLIDNATANRAQMAEELPRLRAWVEANCRSAHTLTQIQKMAGQAGFSPDALWIVWQS